MALLWDFTHIELILAHFSPIFGAGAAASGAAGARGCGTSAKNGPKMGQNELNLTIMSLKQ